MENARLTQQRRAAVASLLALTVLWALIACGGGSGQGGANAILTWTAPDSTAVTGYRVYYGLASGSYLQAKGAGISVERVETHVVTGLSTGTHYYFAVTAVDASGNESDYSNEASKVVQ
jgi:fibronectin type 3 domain-containing protein